MPTNWNEQTGNLEALASQFGAIERKALRAVANVIKPRLAEAAPVRVSEEQSGTSLPQGALRDAVQGHVNMGDGTNPPTATIDFGKLSHIAHMVDAGHRAPHAKAFTRAGHAVTGRPTPAHPFVRSVQDSSAELAQQTFETAMTEGITAALEGN